MTSKSLLAIMVAGVLLLGGWVLFTRLDREDPWLKPSEQVTVLGPRASFLLKAGDQHSGLRELRVSLVQGGQEKEVLTRTFPPGGEAGAAVEVPVALDAKAAGLKEGPVTLRLSATDRSWSNFFRGRSATLSWEAEVHLVPLTISLVAHSRILRAGGTGFVVYRVSKPPKESGVQIRNRFYPGFPLPKAPEGHFGAFFPLPLEVEGPLPLELVARGGGGNEARQTLSVQVARRTWRQDKINLSEGFLREVAAKFPEAQQGDLLQTFLTVNQKIRQANHERLRQISSRSGGQPLWTGAFQRFPGKPMARFGDRRSYLSHNRQVDTQIHQGEDVASLVHSPVPASNHGVVVLAEPLGIYGNTVVLDHGAGIFSMYSHLSRMDVTVGERVEKGKILGLTGTTGLAGGDHLHYSILVHGDFVDPVEWWDPHWLRDQVDKVWAQVVPAAPTTAAASPPDSTKPKVNPSKKRKR